jgi:hypothetical protein
MSGEKTSLRSILVTAVFAAVVGGFFLLNLLRETPDVSMSERRELAAFPKLSIDTLTSGRFMDEFEAYGADRFVFRENLRAVRAYVVFRVFFQLDKSGLYLERNGVSKIEKTDEAGLRQTAQKLSRLAQTLDGLDLYYAVIPDKSYFARRVTPGFDPETVRRVLSEELAGLTGIDLTAALGEGDFYRTDLHWDQSHIDGVLDALCGAMGLALDRAFTEHDAGAFQGVYAGQLALPLEPDRMTYLTNAATDAASVGYFSPRAGAFEDGGMYDLTDFAGRDPYDLFLRGVQPLIQIDNPLQANGRILYLFRDSYGSSLAPLLVSAYSRIVVIDLRYIDARTLPRLVDFIPGSDALFLYSAQILNNPSVFRVQ